MIVRTTSAAISNTIKVDNEISFAPPKADYYASVPCTICVSGTLTGETITIEYYNGTDWQELKSSDSTTTLTANNTVISIFAPVMIRINKPSTANSVGVIADVKRSA